MKVNAAHARTRLDILRTRRNVTVRDLIVARALLERFDLFFPLFFRDGNNNLHVTY